MKICWAAKAKCYTGKATGRLGKLDGWPKEFAVDMTSGKKTCRVEKIAVQLGILYRRPDK